MKGGAAIPGILRSERGPSLDGAVVVVLGYARSGRAASRLLAEAGARVRVTDVLPLERLRVSADEVPGGPEWIGTTDESVLVGCDLVIASPGVPPSNPILAAALASDRPVHSELELAWWFTDSPLVAITGTNGKTTTTELLGAMGRASGRSTVVCGNVGTPLSAAVRDVKPELLVVEVSSFQLFLCEDFRPHVGALLNLTPDHLDWHPDFEHYAAAKGNLFARQLASDACVLNGADPEVAARFERVPSERYLFREAPAPERGAFIRDERLTFRIGEEYEPVVALSEWRLPGLHNRENLMAAALCARLIGLDDDAIREGARGFTGLPHRMEEVGRAREVVWINDSKSTNPGSLSKALDPDVPTLLIAGGVTKGCDFRPVRDAAGAGCRIAFLIGEGARELEEAWKPVVKTVPAGTLEAAVRLAAEEAKPGERVLLSPGCASFDQFDNYVHRGERFRELVRGIVQNARYEGGRNDGERET
jgi:UDP-N-acetylmuramoylalanine--D-glutamate ligase